MRNVSLTNLDAAVPPSDLDAEKGVLGSMLLDPNTVDQVTRIIEDVDFHARENGILFRHMVEMRDAGEPSDGTTLSARLRAGGEFEAIGGTAYLAEVATAVPYAANAVHYATIVREKSQRRRLVSAGLDLIRNAHDDRATTSKAVEAAENAIAAATGQHAGVVDSKAGMVAAIDVIDAAGDRGRLVETGLRRYDAEYGGFGAGELVVLAARPGIGKSALALAIAEHIAARQPVLFASIEMSAAELNIRRLCMAAGVDSQRVRTGQLDAGDRRALIAAGNDLATSKLFILGGGEVGVGEIRREARRLAAKPEGLGLIVIDYLGLIAPEDPRIRRHEQIGAITRRLKITAGELATPILLLSQLNRESDKTEEPRLSHLRESGSIEQDADVAAFIHRQDQQSDEAELIVAKHRHGPLQRICLHWDGATTTFSEASAAREWEP